MILPFMLIDVNSFFTALCIAYGHAFVCLRRPMGVSTCFIFSLKILNKGYKKTLSS